MFTELPKLPAGAFEKLPKNFHFPQDYKSFSVMMLPKAADIVGLIIAEKPTLTCWPKWRPR
jgi:hypothetical protein